MVKINKTSIAIGALLAVSFLGVLLLIFSPVFGEGRNGLTYADDMFNSLSKGSSYFIPDLRKNAEKFNGQVLSVKISAAKPEDKPGDTEARIENISKVLTAAGAKIEVTGTDMKIEGDLGAILASALNDSDAMYKNQGEAIKTRYSYDDEKKIFKQWHNAFTVMDKALKKDKKVEQAKIVSDVSKKAVETAYNYYKVEAVQVKEKAVLMTALLVFYVIYTMWWGFAIYFLFDGIGLSMSKAKH
ncbi:MAG: hypothetical protein Q8K68_03380 [Nitrospirota bacterium]|nr:hypothetical protein [Nitrospirota bacterium]